MIAQSQSKTRLTCVCDAVHRRVYRDWLAECLEQDRQAGQRRPRAVQVQASQTAATRFELKEVEKGPKSHGMHVDCAFTTKVLRL